MKKVYKFVSFATAALLMSSSLVQTADQEVPEVPPIQSPEVPTIQSPEDVTVQSNEVPVKESPKAPAFEWSEGLIDKSNEVPAIQSPEVPAVQSPEVPAVQSPEVPAIQSPEVPAVQSPEVPAIQSPEVPAIQSPEVPAIKQPEVPAIKQPEVPAIQSPEVPAIQSPEVPAIKQPEVPAIKQPEVPTIKQPEVPTIKSPEVPAIKQPEVPAIKSHEDVTVQSNEDHTVQTNENHAVQSHEDHAVQSHDLNKVTDPLLQKEQELMQLQMQLNQKWAQLRQEQLQRSIQEQEAQIKKYQNQFEAYQKAGEDSAKYWNELSIKQQLSGIVDSFKDQGGEIFDQQSQSDQNVTLHLDTVNGLIGVFSDNHDTKGRPVSQWELNKNSGLIIKTRRAKDGSEVHVTEKQIDVDTLNIPRASRKHMTQGENSWFATPTYSFDDEFDLEQQRDMAFKIMQFMIGFIIVTFGLLYLFFRMTQENEQEARKQHTNRVKAINNRDSSFIDFLSGRMDYEYIVKPEEDTRSMRATNFDVKTPTLSDQYTKAQMVADAQKDKMRATHRINTGFGGNNLEHLADEERGRFDHIDIEGTNKNDFSLLANFSKN